MHYRYEIIWILLFYFIKLTVRLLLVSVCTKKRPETNKTILTLVSSLLTTSGQKNGSGLFQYSSHRMHGKLLLVKYFTCKLIQTSVLSNYKQKHNYSKSCQCIRYKQIRTDSA